jgi:hypothetical protein
MPPFKQLGPGYYYPRIHRQGYGQPDGDDEWWDALRATGVVLRLYTRDLERIFEVMEPAESNLGVYGHRIRQPLSEPARK